VRSKDPRAALEDILEHIARIERFISGVDEQAFQADDKTMFAVQYALLAISEAAHRLGDDAEALCPGIPWGDVRGLGNRLRHGYDSINPAVIWRTVQQDLRSLQLAAMIALNALEDREDPDQA
jgi:uncharacterized protein with HEPN domain